MFGGDTLHELRVSLYLAEQERKGVIIINELNYLLIITLLVSSGLELELLWCLLVVHCFSIVVVANICVLCLFLINYLCQYIIIIIIFGHIEI